MQSCPLCQNLKSLLFFEDGSQKQYYQCQNCKLVFLNRKQLLSTPELHNRYKLHTNSLEDANYLNFLKSALLPLLPHVRSGQRGLDFGCGPVKAMQLLLEGYQVTVESYDELFFSDKKILEHKFNFIIMSEVAEHLIEPAQEFALLTQRLVPGGHLLLSTHRLKETQDFGTWYYRRDPTHINFFKDKTLEWLADKYNLHCQHHSERVTLLTKSHNSTTFG